MTTPLPRRRRVELLVGPALVLIARLPRLVPFVAVLGLLVGGLLLTGPLGAALLAVLALLLGTLLYLTWPALPPQPRALRLGVLLLVVVAAASRF